MRANGGVLIFYRGLKGTYGFFCLFEQTSNKYDAEMQTAFILRSEAIQRNTAFEVTKDRRNIPK